MIEHTRGKKTLSWILLTGLLTGTIDATFAIVMNSKIPAALIFRYIASGIFGTAAFSQGTEMVYYGVLLHYCIAFTWTAAFFMLYPKLLNLVKFRSILILITGPIIWAGMNLIVIPLSHVASSPIHLAAALKDIGILIVAFGLPITVIADKFYTNTSLLQSNIRLENQG